MYTSNNYSKIYSKNYYNNILDNILDVFDNNQLINNNNLLELNYTVYDLIYNYILDNIQYIIYYDFDTILKEDIHELLSIQFDNIFEKSHEKIFDFKLRNIINNNINKVYNKLIPPRSYKKSFIRKIIKNSNKISEKIDYIKSLPQPDQRTEEWYIFRHKLLTASSIWKVFKSDSTRNQLIYEKCKPYSVPNMNHVESSLHWGHKYEPVSVNLYENLYNTKVGDFGCIQHPKYPYIGASPDGINIDSENIRYGRMLEIKNIVNRVIDGIPKMEYWIQMQIQMETCNLNECDFLETHFIEYENYDAFINDGNFNYTKDNKFKGIILAFTHENNIYYEYAPFYNSESEFRKWEKDILDKNIDLEREWAQNIYWKLEKYSNVLVLRNKLWFNSVKDEIKNLWEIIEREKINGYEHRAPKKRVNTCATSNSFNSSNKNNNTVSKCMINLIE